MSLSHYAACGGEIGCTIQRNCVYVSVKLLCVEGEEFPIDAAPMVAGAPDSDTEAEVRDEVQRVILALTQSRHVRRLPLMQS